MVGNHYLSSIIGLFFSSSSTFLTQRSKEEQAVSCRERRTDRSEFVNHAWWDPNHTIYAIPRQAFTRVYQPFPRLPGPCTDPPASECRVPPDPGTTTVLRRQGTPFRPPLLRHWQG